METYNVQEIELKIKNTEEKYKKQMLKGAGRDLLNFLKDQIEYFKRLREELIREK